MFKIIGENGSIWYYDANTNKVYNNVKQILNLYKLPLTNKILFNFHSRAKYFKDTKGKYLAIRPEDKIYFPEKNITDLTIQLGLNCNYSCIYCFQHDQITPEKVDLDSFLFRLKNSKLNWESIKVIQLWGGEPLVYWKHLTKIVEFIRKEIPQFKGYFHLTTNGSLLDMKKAEFFVKHRIRLQVSHDGVNQKLTRNAKDWLDDPEIVNTVMYLCNDHHLGDVAMTFGPMFNCNLFDSLALFDQKIPGVKISCRWPLRCDRSNAHLLDLFTPENKEELKSSYYKLIMLQPGDKYYDITYPTRYRLQQFIRNFVSGQEPESIAYACPSRQKYEMTFNLKGNYIGCHGTTDCSGHGGGNLDDLDSCYRTGFTSLMNRKICKGCLYNQICQGPCGLQNGEDYERIHCESTKWAWEAWFAAVWKSIFGEMPIKVEEVSDDILKK